MPEANFIFSEYGTTVFEVMSRLAVECDAINLGQGFPDEDGPDSLKQLAGQTILDFPNQYPPMLGIPALRQAVADHNRRFYGLECDWQTEVMISSGATEALAACLLALINPGDEVIVLEPLYDCYLPLIRRAGATPITVRLRPPDWRIPEADLRSAFSSRTKLLLLNTPHNPTGKVFSAKEMDLLAQLLEQFNVYGVSDEVYEHLVFDDHRHRPLISQIGMRERVVRIGSAGKTFSMTGWKVGYITAAPPLLNVIAKAHQFLVFTTPPNLQRAVAHGLDHEQAWYTGLASELQRKRDLLANGLTDLGFDVLPCQGTYFLNADFRPLGWEEDDVTVCERLTREARVTAVPVSAFHSGYSVKYLLRFCFCKREEVLLEALARLGKYLRG